MSKLLIPLAIAPTIVMMCLSVEPVISQELQFCDPVGRFVSGLEVDEDSELLCADATLPTPSEETTLRVVCFRSNTVEETDLAAGEPVFVNELCPASHNVVECGNSICFAPRGTVVPITISTSVGPHNTLFDWDDIPESDKYVVEVFEDSVPIFSAQSDESYIEAALVLSGDEIISVTAVSQNRFIIGYGSI